MARSKQELTPEAAAAVEVAREAALDVREADSFAAASRKRLKDCIVAARAKGATLAAIADAIGTSRQYVHLVLKGQDK